MGRLNLEITLLLISLAVKGFPGVVWMPLIFYANFWLVASHSHLSGMKEMLKYLHQSGEKLFVFKKQNYRNILLPTQRFSAHGANLYSLLNVLIDLGVYSTEILIRVLCDHYCSSTLWNKEAKNQTGEE